MVGAGTKALARPGPTTWSTPSGRWAGRSTPPEAPGGCLLVGGGYGAAPLFFLAAELRARGCRVDLVTGAATAAPPARPHRGPAARLSA